MLTSLWASNRLLGPVTGKWFPGLWPRVCLDQKSILPRLKEVKEEPRQGWEMLESISGANCHPK